MAQCTRCKGDGAQPGTEKTTCSQCNGSGQVKFVQRTMLGSFSQVTTCTSCQGAGSVIKNPCLVCHGKGIEKVKKTISVDIPAGVDNGLKLRVSGEGNYGASGGTPGDLYVYLNVKQHRYFEREEKDVYIQINLPFTLLVLGAKVDVPTLSGSATLNVPAGTQSGAVMRMKGKGIPSIKGFGKGDQYVTVQAELPTSLNKKEKGLFQELCDIRDDHRILNAKGSFDYVSKL
tara:strand:- start:118 stop:810 length:693 start_codon:yes stop_codon:yes gene_type:complete